MTLDRRVNVEMTEGLLKGGFLDSPGLTLASEILPGLWMGGCEDGTPLPHDFRFVLSLYPWGKYVLGPDTDRVQVRMFDGEELPSIKLMSALAILVNQQHDEAKKVLVHCQAGLNRSALVLGLALIHRGMKPEDAIALLRAQRDTYVLCNRTFERFLLGL